MSFIPPLVCDTPPPIDFEDSHEDDFGDGIFSNYDGKYLFYCGELFSYRPFRPIKIVRVELIQMARWTDGISKMPCLLIMKTKSYVSFKIDS